MKRIFVIVFIFFPVAVFSQVLLKAGAALGNRWNEALNSQALGKGFRAAAEKFIIPQFTFGLGVSYLSFNPNKLVNVRFNSYSLLSTYYLNKKKLQPYIGSGIGYTRYSDKTTIALGAGVTSTQNRNKSYGVISPFLGLQYPAGNKKRAGFFFQANADFVPVAKIQPIGFMSIAAGLIYHSTAH